MKEIWGVCQKPQETKQKTLEKPETKQHKTTKID